ncbi:efflux RND transporter periplasmic adaptor subunit [Marivivens donghaensis]|uniref:efflux RND transporter periplasmic adaptor subunit n=1 Tax=Marivivens donghaensis TaxID=1699413 RepID=UPI00201EB997|nr:HlyD family efflux transporter periplasmic adaptor subunit [Marivivens donghaensis]MCL7408500.1 HlyD family efflux transporter periplasmic adaptor subunit [Marivivens donghaensis]MDN3704729.1 HlyD family efflux transporter periplasmic adaptor subunit [Marivivens donghaensis]
MRFLRRSLTGVFLLGLTLALLAIAGNSVRSAIQARLSQEAPNYGQRERIASVNVLTVQAATLQPEITVFGEVRSQRTLVLRSPVGGNVISADPVFVEGGAVKAGQTLLQIDPTEAQTSLALAQADLKDAEAELREAEGALDIARDSLTEAQAQANLRQAALERSRALRERGTVTASDVETAELAVAAANSSVLSQRQSLAQAEARVDQAGTSLDRVRLSVADAERTLSDTTITASFDGTLSDVSVVEGGRVTANEQIAQLIDPSALEVAFRVSTAQYARLIDANGDLLDLPVQATLDVSGFTLEAQGRVTRESPTVADGQTGRLLYASIDSAPGLRPGDFVMVRIVEPPLDNVVLAPATAVGSDGAVLALDDEDRLETVPVTVLRRQGDDVILAVGDLNGRRIVAERSPLLGAGIKVNPLGEAGDEAAAPEMIELDADRRQKLVSFVTGSQMPDAVKARLIAQLEQDTVPAETVQRIESRMGS